MKNFKILLLFISLIIYSNCEDDDCAKLTPEETCTANTSCQWNAAKCSGDTGSVCSAKSNTNQSACEAETFSGTIKCKYVAESSTGDCTNTTETPDAVTCAAKESKAACTGTTGCAWTPTSAAACTGDDSCKTVTSPSEANCAAKTYSGSANCEWSDAVCGTKPAETPSSTTPADSLSGYIKFSYFAGLFFFLF